MLSMKAKYALKALALLAENHKTQMQAHAIAEQGHIPYKFLETILGELKSHGFVISKRGVAGGYMLGDAPENITVGRIIRMIDGPLAPLRCASLTQYRRCDDCVDEGKCAVRDVMIDARLALSEIMDRRTLKDMVDFSALSEAGVAANSNAALYG
jgi:Rrf2 family protein